MPYLVQKEDQLTKVSGAVILAGGDSTRLGQPKALLKFDGKMLIELIVEKLQQCFSEITIVTDKPHYYDHLSVRLTGDLLDTELKSPLRGIHAGLSASKMSFQFVVGCDMPFILPALIGYMSNFLGRCDAVVPRNNDHFQPLHAFYHKRCVETIEEQIRKKEYKVSDFFSHINTCYINREEIIRYDPFECSFLNINTWSDYKKALACYLAGQGSKQNKGGF